MAVYQRLALALASVSYLWVPVQALGLPAPPTVAVTLDGVVVGTPEAVLDDTTGTWVIESFFFSDPSNGQVSLSGVVLDPDPQISYNAAIIDFGGPSVFGFIFGLPIVPTPAPGVVTHQQSSSTTTGISGGNTAVTALAPPGGVPVDTDGITEQFVYTLSQNGGVTLLNAGLDIRGSFVGADPSDTQGAISLGPIAGPAAAGFYDFMRIDVNFSMAGDSDAYTWGGFATVIPEPTTALLLALGLGGLAVSARRR